VAFANPVPVDTSDPDGVRTSSGCAVTPQFTGTAANGVDNGLGATLADIEADPADYYVDVHTEDFAPGAVRGQFALLDLGDLRPVGTTAPTAPGTTVAATTSPSGGIGQVREAPGGHRAQRVRVTSRPPDRPHVAPPRPAAGRGGAAR
jgi:hypothetical protein